MADDEGRGKEDERKCRTLLICSISSDLCDHHCLKPIGSQEDACDGCSSHLMLRCVERTGLHAVCRCSDQITLPGRFVWKEGYDKD